MQTNLNKKFKKNGYVIIPNILDQTEIDEYISEFNKWKNYKI